MTSDPERSAAEDTVVVDADAQVARDEAWPVAELYRVAPEDRVGEDRDDDETLLLADAPDSPRRRRPELGTALVASVLIVGALVLAAALLALRDDGQPSRSSANTPPATTPTVPPKTTPTPSADALPNLEGMTLSDARDVLGGLGLRANVRMTSADRPRGIVLRQEPAEGTSAARETPVKLVVSSGPAPEAVTTAGVLPVVGRSASAAVAALREAGFETKIRLVTSTERAGLVVSQSPAGGATAKRGSSVRLDVARARTVPPRIEVPDLVGMDAADARQRLAELGLTVEVVRVSSPQSVGTVLRQTPRAGAHLAERGRVTLSVSSGPRRIDVVDVTGLDEESARTQLETAGFEVSVTYEPTSDPAEDGSVLRQTPAGGTSASPGSLVTIVVARLA
jgi:beta-lactam-binding protein with PASTA domain